MHKSYDKFDLDSPEGQSICQKYLNHVENIAIVIIIIINLGI
jgi:hypothetical protein